MLSSNITATPRPRPPAQTRRQPSISFKTAASSPPPPYGASLAFPSHSAHKPPVDTLLGSPISNVIGWDAPGPTSDTTNSDAMNERSRDELSELLMKADGLIKERENGMLLIVPSGITTEL